MATAHPIRSATASLHEGIVIDTSTPAVIFNPAADVSTLLGFVHGQLAIMHSVLHHSACESDNVISPPLLALIEPAVAALELAAEKLQPSA